MNNNSPSPAVEAAKKRASNTGQPHEITLPTGKKARIVPVSASLISEVTGSIKDPEVPVLYLKDKELSLIHI